MNVHVRRDATPPFGVKYRETTAPRGLGEPRIGTWVFGASPKLARDFFPAALLACALHVGVAGWAGALGSREPAHEPAVREVLDVEFVVREPPPTTPAPPAPEPRPSEAPIAEAAPEPAEPAEPAPRPRAKARPAVPQPAADAPAASATPSGAAPVGEAPAVLTASPAASGAVFDFTSGQGPTYGGTVSAQGTRGARGSGGPAGPTAGATGEPSHGRAAGRSKARAIGLRGDAECRQNWPAAAQAFSGTRQVVAVRVRIDARGHLADAWVEKDPGYGFGPAALECIRRKRFTPARNAIGEPVEATSPPIEVEFIRPGP